MIPERKDPYAALIEQFMQNTQGAAQANEQRFMGMREERLIDEQRDFQTGRDDVAREAQLDDAARLREQQLTDAATSMRNNRVNQMVEVLSSMDPKSQEFQEGMQFLEALRTDPGLTGQAALDYVINGNLTVGDETVNVLSRLPLYVNRSRTYLESLEDRSTIRQGNIDFVMDQTIPAEERVEYYNNFIAGSDAFSDEVKADMLRASNMVDANAIEAIVRAGRVEEAQIRASDASVRASDAQVNYTNFQLRRGEKFMNIEYDEIVQRTEAGKQAMEINARAGFMETGYVPTDAAAAQALANGFGFRSVEDLRASGRARYARIQRLEQLEIDLGKLAVQQGQLNLRAGAKQIDLMEVQTIAQEIANDRNAIFGYIEDRTKLGELAFAAARNGDTETLRMLQGLQNTEEFGEALVDIQFDTLINLATTYAGEAEDTLSHNREMRALLLGEAYRVDEEGRRAFFATAGATFAREDFTPGPDGRRPVDDQIDAFIDGMSSGAIRAAGGEDVVRAALEREAYRAKDNMQRSEAGAVLETLSETVPSPTFSADGRATNSGAISDWRTVFVDTAITAGIDREVAEVIAAGLLDGSNAAYYKAWLEAEETKARTGLYLAQAAQIEWSMQPEDVDADAIPALTQEQFTALDSSLNRERQGVQDMFDSGGCGVNPEGSSINLGNIQVDCEALEARIGVLQEQSGRLRSAFVSQEPFHLEHFYGTEISDDTGALAVVGDRTITQFGNAVDLAGLEILREDARQNPREDGRSEYEVLRISAGAGVYRTAEDMNLDIAEALGRVAQRPAPIVGRPLAETDIDTNSNEWREKSVEARVEALEGTTEWNALVQQMVGPDAPELGDARLRDLAGQFGFIRPQNAVERGLHGVGLRDMSSFDVAGLRRALDISASKARRARIEGRPFIPGQAPGSGPVQGPSRTPPLRPEPGATEILASNPGSTQAAEAARNLGLVTSNNTASNEVFQALMVAESRAQHRNEAGDLTRSPAGALGVTQIMALTGWSPGYGIQPLFRMNPADNATMQTYRQQRDEAAGKGDWDEVRRVDNLAADLALPYVNSLDESAFQNFGRRYLDALLIQTGGDLPQALAAYNAGLGTVNRVVSIHGGDWLENMPREETRAYVPKILAGAVANLNQAGANVQAR